MPPGAARCSCFRKDPPFQMTTEPGVLVSDGLPGPVGERYRKNNIALAAPPIVLNLRPGATWNRSSSPPGSVHIGLCHAGRRRRNGPAPAATDANIEQRAKRRTGQTR